MKVYVASSWRNKLQPDVVAIIRAAGHEVYDFRNPEEGELEELDSRRVRSWAQSSVSRKGLSQGHGRLARMRCLCSGYALR